jgi:Na+/melibiose symporter-like transporter
MAGSCNFCIFVVAVYILSLILTLGVFKGDPRLEMPFEREKSAPPLSPYSELKERLSYTINSGPVFAIICLAFLANLTAFPITHGLIPYITKNIMSLDENGLGQLLAVFLCELF